MKSLPKGTYFEVLEIPIDCPQHEITKAYERAKLTYSSDNPALYTVFSGEEIKEIQHMIEEAYAILGNANYRLKYIERLSSEDTKPEDLTFKAIVGNYVMPTVQKNKTVVKANYQINHTMEEAIRSEKNCDGSYFKKIREYKNISIEKMSEITRVSSTYLNALETNNYRSLPAPVFVRGFVVQVARVLGVDEKHAADSYLRILKSNLVAK
jgi:curved DNA-binding protein CbpA